jgi:hypothetical protein
MADSSAAINIAVIDLKYYYKDYNAYVTLQDYITYRSLKTYNWWLSWIFIWKLHIEEKYSCDDKYTE